MNNKNYDVGGEAYGFFHSDASREIIEEQFPKLLYHEAPDKSSLYLTEGMDNVEGNDGLLAIVEEVKEYNKEYNPESEKECNYMLKVTCPGITNKEAADVLEDMFNLLSYSPVYTQKDREEKLQVAIAYKENGKYVFRDPPSDTSPKNP